MNAVGILRYAPNPKKLCDVFCYKEKISSYDVKAIASLYRNCPLGAHIDHQGAPVLGMNFNACTLMAFHPSDDNFTKLRSQNYSGKVKFDLRNIPESTSNFWEGYPQAAANSIELKPRGFVHFTRRASLSFALFWGRMTAADMKKSASASQ